MGFNLLCFHIGSSKKRPRSEEEVTSGTCKRRVLENCE